VLAQIPEYLVRLLDVLLFVGSIEWEIDIIQLDVVGVNDRKSHRLLLLISFFKLSTDRVSSTSTGKENFYPERGRISCTALWRVLGGFQVELYNMPLVEEVDHTEPKGWK
jgi:hypothetical protein